MQKYDMVNFIDGLLIPDLKKPVKILGSGKLSRKLTVVAGWYSKSAHAKIGGLGGAAQSASGGLFEFPPEKKKFVPREPVKKKAAAEPAEAAAPAAEAPKAAEPPASA